MRELVWRTEELLEELEFGELDSFMKDIGSDMSFYELVRHIIDQGWGVESIADLVTWVRELLFAELQANRELFIEIILITFCFSLLKNSVGSFGNSYVSDTCFLLVYGTLAMLFLNSIYIFQTVVTETIENGVAFMRMFVPLFCTGMIFSSNVYSSTAFYQLAFLLIYLVEGVIKTIILPFIHIYVVLQICNHFFEESNFGNMADLVKSIVNAGMKLAVTVVFGLNVVQNLMNPVKDRMAQGILGRAVSFIPGVGGVANSAGEILLGAGMLIKSGVGMAGMVALLFLGVGPLMKAGCMVFFYKLMAAITEPMADKRISDCIKDLSVGAGLYLKVLGYSLALFMITIALTISATSFTY